MDKPDSTMSAADGTSCGGAVAGSIFGTIACIILLAVGAWLFYKKYWKHKSETNPLVEDAENSKVDYAFDNPAFKGDNNKNASPFDSKWKTPDKRKTVDDSYANATIPRLVPLRGSDFTGLGIEVCGGLKDGIFVKKVMPQGPAANIVHRGDKITSITIDFRHIVQEDAATILSYASPYNVQLELVDSNGMLSNVLSQNVNQPAALTHPLYRPRSQEDLNTIERNARKKLFSKDDNSYPTLKMDQQQHSHVQPKPRSPAIQLPQAHEENEKKNSLKKIQNYFIDMVEEKFQTKASHSNESGSDGKKGMKFGIRVLPPTLNGKDSGKSPNKVQADNDNNANIEKIEHNTIEPIQQQQQQQQQQLQQQQPHSPAPPEAMKRSKNKSQDAKKANSIQDDNKPVPFERQASINSSGIKRDAAGIPQEVPTEMMQAAMTAVNNRTKVNSIDRKSKGKAPIPPARGEYDESSADHVDNIHVVKLETVEMPQITTMKVSITGSQPDLDSDAEYNGKSVQQIELNSNHITVHQASEEEEESNEERRTASLGDLSKLEHNKCINNKNRPTNGTLERAQSLEMSDANNQIAAGKVTPKKRKAHPDHDLVEVMELKEPRFSEPIIEHLEPLQTVRLKSSYEWGNLEDAIYDGKDKSASDDSFELESPQKKLSASSMDMMSEVLAAADKFDKEINDIELHDVMNEMPQVEFDDVVNGVMDETIRLELVQNNEIDMKLSGEPSLSDDSNEIQTTSNGIMIESNDQTFVEDEPQQNITQINLSTAMATTTTTTTTATVHLELKSNDNHFDDIAIDSPKTINYGTNVSDDAKASRYPLSTLERPKSEVLKQLIAQQVPGDTDDKSMDMNGISYAKSVSIDGPINISVAVHTDSDASESVQISPVFSSDGSGVNNISISSTESDSKDSIASPMLTTTTTENRITISTSDSQPASIIIEDETLNFKMQTLDDEPNEQSLIKSQSANGSPKKNEVFIVESLSSKKSQESLLPVSQNGRETKPPTPGNKGFVTEIRFPNANKDKQMNAKNLSKSMENQRNHSPETKNGQNEAKASSPNDSRKTTNEKPVIVEEEYIPRNNEIRFTTSTYQSPRQQFEKRHSQIDQIRSNFERSHTSEIPIPIRKTSTPSTPPPPQSSNVARVSPSKIPVFTSQKSSDNLLKNNNSTNRVSVTSIKNSSRNPSGK
ncbi:inner centromere protein A-like [Contarinia nasturtii]|uniref:inner centromere protein A-like n=1 Tax=Contarinia nasturtii TaxID=265458 RepID=UPI0012D47D5E|nr:inner centromere protein A-like [Contarinia nasturtii]XP_031624605.1 inner centromere protein A-like [Contarinia nasturtii]XP_031624613.1 inner centromere protein A-like [Contarinia nasturtii]XP_031624622.1 inner centromere protein A-like [Contarinia nasturtii]